MSRTPLRIEPLEDRLAPAAGQIDTTFGTNGTASVPQSTDVLEVAILPGDSIAAIASNSGQGDAVVAYQANGAVNTGFGNAGRVEFPGQSLAALTADASGNLLIVGRTPSGEVLVTRLDSNGNPDATFGVNGVASAPLDTDPNSFDAPSSIAIGPGGVIIIAGSVGGQPPFATTSSFAATRLTSIGQVDTTFGLNGISVVSFAVGSFNSASALAVDIDTSGRAVLAGSTVVGMGVIPINDHAVIRLTSDGELDTTFGNGGRVRLPRDPAANAINVLEDVAVLPDGTILVAGVVSALNGVGGNFGVAARLLPNGSLDAVYGNGGLGSTASTPKYNASIMPDGSVLFTGAFNTDRLTPYGQKDTRFVSDTGLQHFAAVQSDGQIIVSGRQNNSGSLTRLNGNGPPPGFVPSAAGMIMASGENFGTVRVLQSTNGNYSQAGVITGFPGFSGNIRSTTADVNGDNVPDYLFAAGPGGLPQITVFDGVTGDVIVDMLAFEASFRGGVFVAAADIDGDGTIEIVATPDQGGGPRVVIFTVDNGTIRQRASFYGIDDPDFRGGARIAIGDLNKDGTPDLLVAAGFLGGPRVSLLDGRTVLSAPTRLIGDFFAFPGPDAASLRNGAYVAAGDINGDGFADLIFGAGPGGAARIFILDGATVTSGDVAGAQEHPIANFFTHPFSTDRGGVRVAAVDADGDSKADLVAGSGVGSFPSVKLYLGTDITGPGGPGNDEEMNPFPVTVTTLMDGVYVGA